MVYALETTYTSVITSRLQLAALLLRFVRCHYESQLVVHVKHSFAWGETAKDIIARVVPTKLCTFELLAGAGSCVLWDNPNGLILSGHAYRARVQLPAVQSFGPAKLLHRKRSERESSTSTYTASKPVAEHQSAFGQQTR